jgi:DNA-binding transcriptional LysR family regulator
MDFDQLETFLEVARSLSFSRAAEKRFRTQPAISSQIRALEEEVGAKLFDRSGGKVSLTSAGKTFQKYVEESLLSRRNVITAMAELERIPRGELVVAANEGTSLHILPEVFAEFKRQYPNVSVSIMRSEHAKILEYVIDNTVDFGVVSLPVNDNRMQSVVIHRDNIVVIAAPSHTAAKLKQPRLADLAQFPVVLPKLGRTRDAIENAFHAQNLKLKVSMELDSSELLKRFVAAGVGIGFIARSNVVEDVRAGALAAASVADLSIRRDLALLFRKDKALSRAALAFIEIAVKIKNPQPLAAEAKH